MTSKRANTYEHAEDKVKGLCKNLMPTAQGGVGQLVEANYDPVKEFRKEYPGKQHLLQTLIKKFKFEPIVAVYALLSTGVQNNIQVAIMFVVDADEDNDGKM